MEFDTGYFEMCELCWLPKPPKEKNFMRLFLLLFLSSLALANPWTNRKDLSSSNLAATFGTGANQILTGPQIGFKAVQVDNLGTGEIEINCTQGSTPSSNSADSWYVAAGEGWGSPDNTPLGKKCWWRSVSGTLSTGILKITGWGE